MMTHVSIRRTLHAASVAAVAITLAGLSGCKSTNDRSELVMQEATDLRSQNSVLQSQRDSAEQARREAVAELQAMREQLTQVNDALEQSQRELSAMRAQPTPATTAPATTGPDLGNLGEGVSVSSRSGDVVITVAGDVLFDSGKATLRSNARRTLDDIARTLIRRYPGATYRVEGYTDTDPIRKSGWKSNEHLSAERAIAVEKYLVGRGIENERIYAAAFGPARSKASKKESRRVEIIVLAGD